jgi:hypothetical protein
MKFFLLFLLPLLAFVSSDRPSRTVEFDVDLSGPADADEVCSAEDYRLIVFGLERALENLGTIWLNKFMPDGGYVENADIPLPSELTAQDRRSLYSFLYSRFGCFGCPGDNRDGRRELGQATMADMKKWVNSHLQSQMVHAVKKFTSKSCAKTMNQWGGTFDF